MRTANTELANLPARWDAGWYIGIADGGYRYTDPARHFQNVAFFPAYPLALRAVTTLIHARHRAVVFEWTGVCLSIACFMGASVYLYRLAELYQLQIDQKMLAVALFGSYPFAVFYGAVYSESLYVLAAAGTIYHAQRNQDLPAGLWGICAGLARPTGMLLSLPLGVLVWQQSRTGRGGRIVRFLTPLAPLAGAALYSLFLYSFLGRPLAWVQAQRQWGRSGAAMYVWISQLHQITTVQALEAYLRTHIDDVLNGGALVFVLTLLPLIAIRLDMPLALFALLSLLPGMLFGGLMSMGRLTATIFPVFLVLASCRSQTVTVFWLVSFALGQSLVSAMFFTWRSIF